MFLLISKLQKQNAYSPNKTFSFKTIRLTFKIPTPKDNFSTKMNSLNKDLEGIVHFYRNQVSENRSLRLQI